ncbi:hypothetical protein GDO81_022814 [Engystomops pustulosus]|uniref:Uncharacterized protein n=1 Tax=Engystomops pustulosus TaxID=76066 RepID=A0AAV6YT10_ENGPU|nr:hypothetical protein GDO81_022814 [Engystomops pustulosus]
MDFPALTKYIATKRLKNNKKNKCIVMICLFQSGAVSSVNVRIFYIEALFIVWLYCGITSIYYTHFVPSVRKRRVEVAESDTRSLHIVFINLFSIFQENATKK